MPGYDLRVVDEACKEVKRGQMGSLVVKLPLPPSCLPTLWQADDRMRESYLAEFPGYYKTADAGFIDADGYVFVMGRTDDIINVAGHRLSTGGMEEVLASHQDVAECAVLGIKDELKGEVPCGFIVLKAGVNRPHDEIEKECVALVRELVQPGMHTLDVGAQTGFFTCLMAGLVGAKGRVHAFEPMPKSYQILEKNVHENHFKRIVDLHPTAASSVPATIEGTMVSNMYVVGQMAGGEPVQIQAVRIDEVLTDRVDFIKIDVEGHEPAAIEGARRLIERHRPTILTEVNEYWLRTGSGSSGREYLGLLQSLGYDLFDVDQRDTPLALDSVCLELTDVFNVIALPSRK